MGARSCSILDHLGLILVGTDMYDDSMGMVIEMGGSIINHFTLGPAK